MIASAKRIGIFTSPFLIAFGIMVAQGLYNKQQEKMREEKSEQQVEMGMSVEQVKKILGVPATVKNDKIAREIGYDLPSNLIEFEWRNKKAGCSPVVVDFDSSTLTVNGYDLGLNCSGMFIEPIGKPCENNSLCSLFHQNNGNYKP